MIAALLLISTLLIPARPAFPAGTGAPASVSALVGKRTGDEGAAKRILSLAARRLYRDYPRGQYRFSLKPRWIPGSLLRHDPADIKSVALKGRVDTYTNFIVTFREGRFLRTAEVQLALDFRQKLPVAVRRLNQGAKLKEGDTALRWAQLTPGTEAYVQDPEALTGRVLRRTMRPGEPFRQSEVGGVYVVRAGDVVKLVFERQGLQVQLAAEARQDGALNEEITIYSKETRRKYRGKIIAPGVVSWIKTL